MDKNQHINKTSNNSKKPKVVKKNDGQKSKHTPEKENMADKVLKLNPVNPGVPSGCEALKTNSEDNSELMDTSLNDITNGHKTESTVTFPPHETTAGNNGSTLVFNTERNNQSEYEKSEKQDNLQDKTQARSTESTATDDDNIPKNQIGSESTSTESTATNNIPKNQIGSVSSEEKGGEKVTTGQPGLHPEGKVKVLPGTSVSKSKKKKPKNKPSKTNDDKGEKSKHELQRENKKLKKENKELENKLTASRNLFRNQMLETQRWQNLNAQMQEKIFQKIDEFASRPENVMDQISTAEAALGFIRKIDDTIHCGNNVYIPRKAYDNAKNDAHKNAKADKPLSGYSAFVRNVAMSIIGAETLMKSSVTGKKCNRLNTTPKLKYGIFEYYLKIEKQFNEVDIALHKKHVGGYIAQKCCDLNRKKSKKPQDTDANDDIPIPEMIETTETPTESVSEKDEDDDDNQDGTDESSSESSVEDNQSNQDKDYAGYSSDE